MPEPCSGGRLQGLVPRIYTLALFFCSMHSIHRQPNMHRGRAKQIKCLNTCPELTTREAHSWSVSPKIFDTCAYTRGRRRFRAVSYHTRAFDAAQCGFSLGTHVTPSCFQNGSTGSMVVRKSNIDPENSLANSLDNGTIDAKAITALPWLSV